MQFFKKSKGLFSTKTGSMNKRRGRAGSSKILITMKNNEQNKAMKNETMNK